MSLRAFLLCLFLCAPFEKCLAQSSLPDTLRAQVEAAGLPPDALSYTVQRLPDGATWAAAGADRSVQPASTLKLLTSLVALDTLGPIYRGRSELLLSGVKTAGVFEGDVILRGLGDVDLDAVAFERLLGALRLEGIQEIRGDLVLDRTFFDPARTDVGVPPFDEAPEFRYNLIPDALMAGSNLMHLDLASDQDTVRVLVATPLSGVTVETKMELVDRSCEDWEDGWKYPAVRTGRDGFVVVTLLGEYPRDCRASTAINVIDRVAYTERLFRATWQRLGGKFRGRVRDGVAPSTARLVASHGSRPLSQVLIDINKRSDNPVTRVMFLTLGVASGAGRPTAQSADAVIRAWMETHGIDSAGLVLENGSGLSRTERVTPNQLAAVLRLAAAGPWAPEYMASLPVVAVDGGMRNRLRTSPAAATARIKTGTLRDVTAIAGYVRDSGGGTNVVVAMLNHERATRYVARPILDAIIDWVARSTGPAL
ncbi:D-alanyl-D-alanine carboxypeptidase DacC [Usitatibacter rugosus]|uniref:D-alanyl-D-alanine carboxypeptidase DacC n=1 Tax=Usitatibacter rugosus TaxID=2732067 RepID=A0A6M4GTM6_9PROT|nr:D-alanyl-D-alanine carboxypeptidase/D-alanyl-D-alanine-endopeptidase [Usitatibacter rugosus]QJR10466.1 D-alanyl-D-alanine carboxypeptidase DacC [Usitatibacter rugosus]